MLHQSLQMAGNDGNQQGAGIEPGLAERLQQSLRETHQQQEMNGEPSVLLTSATTLNHGAICAPRYRWYASVVVSGNSG